MMRPSRRSVGHAVVVGGCLLLAVAVSWTGLGARIDNAAYDWMFRLHPQPRAAPQSVVVAIDDTTLAVHGGIAALRALAVEATQALGRAGAAVIVVDLIFSDRGPSPAIDARLIDALRHTPRVVLAAEMRTEGQGWNTPRTEFARHAAAVGHAHADNDEWDGICRRVPLEKATGPVRLWALSLEALRTLRNWPVVESPESLAVGPLVIKASREDSRSMAIRFLPSPSAGAPPIPRLSLATLLRDPETGSLCRGKVAFVGVTSLSAARDRLMTPLSERQQPTAGVEIHAQAFETLAGGRFLEFVPDSLTLLLCVLLAAAMALAFYWLPGGRAYAVAALLVATAHGLPHILFRQGIVLPTLLPVATAWLCLVGAASYQYFVVRRDLRRTEADRARYRQAIHFVTHEMRTPLTAIQGSSELMGRYNLSEDKRRQMAQMINTESKRLARLVQTFLDVERLTDGELALKSELFPARDMVEACVERVRPLAERKQIDLVVDGLEETTLSGDRELMEYAFYNLLTNAVKYSESDTTVTVRGGERNGHWRLSVQDQGMGMDEHEVRQVFRKFYRTRRAEQSGEVGTGIGLSIVEQIVQRHGGRVEVESVPGQGSCFTLALPIGARC